MEALPRIRDPEVANAAPGTYWRTLVLDDTDPPDVVYRHLYVGTIARCPAVLDPLLRLVAGNQKVGVILSPPDAEWLVAPYDGGTDVIAATTFERDALRERHPDWLPDNPSGL
jgi:hypothetical protein